jgi:hypothetical protein
MFRSILTEPNRFILGLELLGSSILRMLSLSQFLEVGIISTGAGFPKNEFQIHFLGLKSIFSHQGRSFCSFPIFYGRFLLPTAGHLLLSKILVWAEDLGFLDLVEAVSDGSFGFVLQELAIACA